MCEAVNVDVSGNVPLLLAVIVLAVKRLVHASKNC